MTIELTKDEIEHLLSLSESEQVEFFTSIPPEQIDDISRQILGVNKKSLNFAAERSAKNAARINERTAAAQEIGPLPEVANPQRRERCSKDNLLAAETYFPKTFYLPWAPYQRAMMDEFQDTLTGYGKVARAVRRGGLKSTCARVSTIWAAINGHRRFVILVGASDDQANQHRQNFFRLMASSELLIDDYPELIPLLAKWKQPKKQFRLDGRLLTVHPKDEYGRIVFADIITAPSCETHVAPYSIASTDVSGLSYVDRNGVTVRPDAIIYDDVQTPQSAQSSSMTDEREERITKTFGGLEGLGQRMSQIMVCTVRQHQDLTERFCDRKRHPDWDGKKFKSVLKMPDRMDLWEVYKTKLGLGATPDDGKALAQAFYSENREQMELGAVVAWEHDKKPDEISALQSLMTIWATDPEFFRREIQQEGSAPVNTSSLKLDSQSLMNRLSNIDKGAIPQAAAFQTAFIDSQDEVLFFVVCAWRADMTGWIVDYGTFPDQGRPIFSKSDLSNRISSLKRGASWEECFVIAHNRIEELLFEQYPDLDILLKDWSDGSHMPLIRGQVSASVNRNRIRPAKGFAPKPGRKPLHLWGEPTDKAGTGWIERRNEPPVHVQFDANIIKTVTARRLLTEPAAPSSLMLPGTEAHHNRLLAEHMTAEVPHEWTFDNTHGVKWELIPGRDNDWWDCVCGCVTGALLSGCKLPGDSPVRREIRTFALPGAARRG